MASTSATLHSSLAAFSRSPPHRRASGYTPRVVRCQGGEKQQPPSTSQTSPPAQKARTGLFDVLAFSGPGPERINGRLAMVGFASALAVEASKGDGLFAQIADGGLPWFLGTAAVLSAASLVPLLKGVNPQSWSVAPATPEAEMWNGRLAMLGLVALAVTEYVKGGPLV